MGGRERGLQIFVSSLYPHLDDCIHVVRSLCPSNPMHALLLQHQTHGGCCQLTVVVCWLGLLLVLSGALKQADVSFFLDDKDSHKLDNL